MAEPTNWTELKANIADWLDRTDLTTQIPEFIGYAERRFNRELRHPDMEESSTASISAAVVTLPTDFLAMKALYIDGAGRLTRLQQLGIEELRWRFNSEETGTPQFFALQSGSELVFAPSPTASVTYVLNYYQKIPALGSGQAANWLLTGWPDVYVAATLAEAMFFLRDAEGLSMWESRASQKIAQLIEQGRTKAKAENSAGLVATDMPLGTTGPSFNIFTGY